MADRGEGCFGCFGWLVILGLAISFAPDFFTSNRNPSPPPPPPVDHAEFDSLMNEGYRLSDVSECEKALEFFKNALKIKPNNSFAVTASKNMAQCISDQIYDASMNEGYTLFKQESYSEALDRFSAALEQRPNDESALRARKTVLYDKTMEFGLSLFQKEDYEMALVVLNAVLREYPDDPKVVEAIRPTISKSTVMRFETDLPVTQTAIATNEKSQFYEIAMFLSSRLAEQGAVDDALVIAIRISQEHPNDSKAKQTVSELTHKVIEQYTQNFDTDQFDTDQ